MGCCSATSMEEKMDLEKIWKTVLSEMEVELGKGSFGVYFKGSSLLELTDGLAKLGFSNKAVADQVNQRYYTILQSALQKATNIERLSLVFEVVERSADAKAMAGDMGPLFAEPKEDRAAIKDATRAAGLRVDYILEEFCVSTSNQLAFAAAQAVIANPGRNYNPLFIWGGVGIGKTHLMQAIGHEIIRKNPRAKVVYAPGEQFTNEIIAGIRRQNTADFKEKYRSADALLIDDIQFLSGKDTAQEEFFHTFNAIQQHEGQIVMTSDRKPGDIADLADRLRSRFEGGMVADISTPDSELKTTICLLKAKKRGIVLSTTIATLISSNVDNIRSLDGAVQLVVTKAATEKREITAEFVAEVLKVPLTDDASGAGRLDARTVLNTICGYYELPIKLIKGEKRDRPIARPRQILMYLLKKHTGMTLDEIAGFLGRDHTTVIHGVRNIETLLDVNERVGKEVGELQKKLGIGG